MEPGALHLGSVEQIQTPVTSALLFDLDGTLVDSDAEHLAAFQRVFAPHGVALDWPAFADAGSIGPQW